MPFTQDDPTYDVAILGGGPAGLAAASTLARQLYTVMVFDSGSHHNAPATSMRIFPTWDGKRPEEFRAQARKELVENYPSVSFKDVAVNYVERVHSSLFELQDAEGGYCAAKKLILAVGVEEKYPVVDGYVECWGKRIFHCLYCHGYEERAAPSSGVLAVDECAKPRLAMHLAENALRFTKTATIYTHGNEKLASEIQRLASKYSSLTVDPRAILYVREVGSERGNHDAMELDKPKSPPNRIRIDFMDNTSTEEAFLVHNPTTKIKGPFVKHLLLELNPRDDERKGSEVIKVNEFYQTNRRGCFAAGDCMTPFKVTANAIASGCNAAIALSTQLQAERFAHAFMV